MRTRRAVSTIVYSVALPWGSMFRCRLQEACRSMRMCNQNVELDRDVDAEAAEFEEIGSINIGPPVVKTRSKEHWYVRATISKYICIICARYTYTHACDRYRS